jgi:hypothetical protein
MIGGVSFSRENRMKPLVLVALLLVSSGGWAQKASKQRFSQQPAPSYPLKLHVTRSFATQNGAQTYLHLVGVVDGQKVELATTYTGTAFFDTHLLLPGDYAARLSGEDTKKDGSVLREYDLQLANGQHEAFTLIGISE